MKKFIKISTATCFLTLFISFAVHAAETMKQDNEHIRRWNAFADNVLKLHHTLIKNKNIKKTKSVGGYSGLKNFYVEEKYINAENGKLISQIQWEREQPGVLHTIEVYVHDQQNRVIRDFIVAYLPGYHNAPSQTLISLHQYNKGLHGFRTFDATGDRILERCMGQFNGEPVELMLDEDELYQASMEDKGVMQTALYKQCFGNLPAEAGKYLLPQ